VTGTGQLFPAGTAVTHLAVYDWSTPDGLIGGSAHVHLACTEGYVVLGGSGRLQTLSQDGFAETRLEPMTVAWFSPGVLHRLINDGGLQILVVMQNGGLPEAGDSVLAFPPGYLASRVAYREVAVPGASTTGETPDPAAFAHRRQQLAVEGFLALCEQVRSDGPAALEDFYEAAVELVRDQVPGWRDIWSSGALAAAERTGEQLDLLAHGRGEHLRQGQLTVLSPPASRSYGMCGRLFSYPARPPGTVPD
jgi:mannose-6-phosphate isomerase-like protein (cupin superfamily)